MILALEEYESGDRLQLELVAYVVGSRREVGQAMEWESRAREKPNCAIHGPFCARPLPDPKADGQRGGRGSRGRGGEGGAFGQLLAGQKQKTTLARRLFITNDPTDSMRRKSSGALGETHNCWHECAGAAAIAK